jgi:ribonucleoside-diphosphate reductase alpha chain
VSEAIGRMVSYVLRIASPVEPIERMQEVIRQFVGIGGGRSLGFGAKRVRSLPDGVAQVLTEYLQQRTERLTAPAVPLESPATDIAQAMGDDRKEHASQPAIPEPPAKDQPLLKIGDLCPECGQAALINEEGCRKCYACGYSEC